MKTYTPEQLKDILAKHKLWLETNGKEGERAILDDASLDGASLDGASLNRASLNRASLNGASLNCASLNRASLNGASLNGASLDGASLNWCKCYYTKGDIVYIGNQGEGQRSITLVKKTRMAFIGCFKGTFDEARRAILEKYGDKAEAITDGYGLTLMAMEAIEKEGEA